MQPLGPRYPTRPALQRQVSPPRPPGAPVADPLSSGTGAGTGGSASGGAAQAAAAGARPAAVPGAIAALLHRTLAPRPPSGRPDPAPSRIAYRLNRLWLTPLFRALLRVGLPAYALVMVAGLLISDDERRAALAEGWSDLRAAIEERPEFTVEAMLVEGASAPVEAALIALGPEALPVSSLRLDLEAMRRDFEALDAVARADLTIRTGGVLEVRVVERVPAVVWRAPDGLFLLDGEGHRIARLLKRDGRADLPLIAGDGAPAQVPEALALLAAAAPLGDAVTGLVRMGERRWDVVLKPHLPGGPMPRILLPERGALAALERVMALHQTQDLLDRDIQAVDLRAPGRPTLRLSAPAVDELRRIRALERGAYLQ